MRRAVLLAVVLACATPSIAAAALVSKTITPAQPDGDNGWYRSPVTVTFDVSAAAETVTGDCAHFAGSQTNIPVKSETALTTLTCGASNSSGGDSQTALIHIDWTAPSTVVSPERAPDAGGFYNHPLTATWTGVDATSGIASCTSTPYSGPDGTGVSLTGTCKDKAGNVRASVPFVFNYDATPPVLTDVTVVPDDAGARLAWQASGAARIVVMRSPAGARAAQTDVVFDGMGHGFTDTHLSNGKRYAYVVQAVDQAGNAASDSVAVTPDADASTKHLLSPGSKSRLSRPPMLRWRAMARASYFNVQLTRNGRKILSAWPTKARYQLRSVWTYKGRRHRLVPGTYRWLLWAGYGHRSEHRYGKLLGKRTFIVT
jgi:hypothetical protein